MKKIELKKKFSVFFRKKGVKIYFHRYFEYFQKKKIFGAISKKNVLKIFFWCFLAECRISDKFVI